MKIVDYSNWKGEKVDYVETTINEKKYWFTPSELINARARWIDKGN